MWLQFGGEGLKKVALLEGVIVIKFSNLILACSKHT